MFPKSLLEYWRKTFGMCLHNKQLSNAGDIIQPVAFEDFRLFLPKYLSDEDQTKLFEQLRVFEKYPDGAFYAAQLLKTKKRFQGDGYSDLEMPKYETKEFVKIKAFLISNTCDADDDNKRLYHTSLVFCPIIDIGKYEAVLKKNSSNHAKVEQHIKDIQAQKISSFFYLPPNKSLQGSFIRMDQLFSIPASMCSVEEIHAKRLFVLSNLGHYLLLFKLSVHFSRVQEGLKRI